MSSKILKQLRQIKQHYDDQSSNYTNTKELNEYLSEIDERLKRLIRVIKKFNSTKFVSNEKRIRTTPGENEKNVILPDFSNKEKLKPGVIPKIKLKPKPIVKNQTPTIVIPNARKNKEYNEIIDGSLKDGIKIKITGIELHPSCGLNFNKDPSNLSGFPTVSGDIKLQIRWKTDSNSHELVNDYNLFINPDPNELWKDKDPDKDDQYYKDNEESKSIYLDPNNIIAASVRGRSHAHEGLFRDDDFFIGKSNSNWDVLIVADGAGSSKYSRQGSRLASNSAGKHLLESLNENIDEKIIAAYDKVTDSLNNQSESIFNELYKVTVSKALECINNQLNDNTTFKDYYTTLLISVHKKYDFGHIVSSLWIGDGAIAVIENTDSSSLMGLPDSGEYSGQTVFLGNSILENSTEFANRIQVKLCNKIECIILMTDGITDPKFENENDLCNSSSWINLWNELKVKIDKQNAEEELKDWIKFPSPGYHDDRTIAIYY